ncbi:c-type cytochrome [Asticcacaulis benevestitus]|uniref:c-type cytochrome n=1 Tax=Asticcacaulis benevestitus TaxID=347481 RepID=UPI0003A8A369|nr:c-type cytochrome [Asticcacaulis benevestitus]
MKPIHALILTVCLGSMPAAVMAKPAKPAPVDPATLALGERAFAQCKACHSIEAGKSDGVGPNLYGFYGSKAGGHSATFKYSAAMKAYGVTWDDKTLDTFLTAPTKAVPGTRMAFRGVTDPKTRAALVDYLRVKSSQ